MSKADDPAPAAPREHPDHEHQIRIGLSMTPAERLRWLEETVEELRPWVGLARRGAGQDPHNRQTFGATSRDATPIDLTPIKVLPPG